MGAILPRNLAFCEADQPCGCMRERMRATYGASLNSHLGRLWERRALGPPSLGEVVVHTTPTAVPASATRRRARHPAMNALGGVGDPQWSAVVADRAGEPPFVERQQPAPSARVRRILIFCQISLTSCSSSLF
jgi:hypothetical protein